MERQEDSGGWCGACGPAGHMWSERADIPGRGCVYLQDLWTEWREFILTKPSVDFHGFPVLSRTYCLLIEEEEKHVHEVELVSHGFPSRSTGDHTPWPTPEGGRVRESALHFRKQGVLPGSRARPERQKAVAQKPGSATLPTAVML
ncbi:hypothetical protein CYMTET_17205 [Cymbomonas tetramitiformis]|uniref:Uncharacterized protein n=1 Tax=Cymbomonas tetramitiformis TaxID=36881 RepID=A0AAE0GAT0_9CHLO|nr:hypothetical protein CYMTET_17205 [Cymbomonas tetramitiformis]